MLDVHFSPEWFYGKDIIIDIFSLFVLVLISFFSIKYYKLNKKNKNYFLFGISFLILAVSFLFKILTNFVIYHNLEKAEEFGFVNLSFNAIELYQMLFSLGFLCYMFFSLLGIFMLCQIYQKKGSKQTLILIVYFLMAITYFSASKYFVFHLTSLFLLIFISFSYSKNYLKKRTKTSRLLLISFLAITFSQLIFIFVNLDKLIYVFAEIFQLLGYIFLLITFIGVFKNAKKK